MVGDRVVHVATRPPFRTHQESQSFEHLEHLGLAGDLLRQALADGVGAELEGAQALRVHVVDLAQCAGRGIAGVGKGLLAAREAGPVEPFEAPDRQDHFAVDRDELHAGAVEFGLARQRHRLLAVEHALHPRGPGSQLCLVHGVVEGEHGDAVGDGREAALRWRPHALRRGVGLHPLRVGGLERLQLAVEAVVLRVGDLGRVLQVVEPQVTVQLVHQGADPTPRVPAGSHVQVAPRPRR